jgi:hypothetical protein
MHVFALGLALTATAVTALRYVALRFWVFARAG